MAQFHQTNQGDRTPSNQHKPRTHKPRTHKPRTHGPRTVLLDDEDLFHQAVSIRGLSLGWDKVWRNKGAAGGDGLGVEVFYKDARGWIGRLRRSLLSGEYRPGPLRVVDIPKKNGKGLRRLEIPCVSDRVVQSSVAQVLSPHFEDEFEPDSFAYRPGRGVTQAVARVSAAQRAGYNWIVDADIRDFFGSVEHSALMERFGESVSDGPLTSLISLWITHAAPQGVGLAQGSPLSPLLANLFLDRLDERFFGRNVRFVRFADDFVIMTKTRERAEAVLQQTESFLAQQGLSLNMDKTQILDFDQGLRFLGHVFVRSLVTKTAPDDRAVGDIQQWMREIARTDTIREKDRKLEQAREAQQRRAGYSPGFRVLYIYESGRRLNFRNKSFTVEEFDGPAAETAEEPGKAGRWTELIAIHNTRVERIEIGPRASLTLAARDLALATHTRIAYVNGHGETVGWTGPVLAQRAGRHMAQAACALDEARRIDLASRFVEGRIRTQRAVLRRLLRDRDRPKAAIDALVVFNRILGRGERTVLRHCKSVSQLMGYEGEAAAVWWPALSALLPTQMQFGKRTRREQTRDGANTVFNFLSWLLHRDITVAVGRAGLHPGFGVLHSAGDNRDACCFDLMEEFRAHLVGGLAVYCINKKIVTRTDFTKVSGGVRMGNKAGGALIRAYEKRVARLVKSPRSGRKLCWRQLMLEQAFAIAAHVDGAEVYRPIEMGY
ncbi:MAG TPA: CRISPR-associated endonuclease Cas1 [Hellea balneolensis]|uniref:CRISPR-associated endonuclease Cas1 n=1 Tax=Hellea balneolensis TaxID=287478 RepID=A0A7C5LSY4_9PROT|nr:CRISPR-associated endonuclease Cas1 [Hellea balneolensis]